MNIVDDSENAYGLARAPKAVFFDARQYRTMIPAPISSDR
jgi:hypothetical protein